MATPTTDRGGMQQVIRALIADGWRLDAVGSEVVSNEREAIAEIEATGYEALHVVRPCRKGNPDASEYGWVLFVLGNAPDEVVCDYTTNLTCVDTLTESWF